MTAYYNDNDPAAAWLLRNLIGQGVIAFGHVDDRSIKDVTSGDLDGFTQCHFFAGGGLWSIAARMAGWPDDARIWTASCPCQPFSAAGKKAGTDDPRHLWPDLFRLVSATRPDVLVGEQVAGKAGYDWFDRVRADLESEAYAARAADIPACAVDAPHQRNRLYWGALGNGIGARLERHAGHGDDGRHPEPDRSIAPPDGRTMVDGAGVGRSQGKPATEVFVGRGTAADTDAQGPMADPDQPVIQGQPPAGQFGVDEPDARPWGRNGTYWSDAEWIECHDGKARRAKSGVRMLVDGFSGRVDLWRITGNAIVPQIAAEVIAALIDTGVLSHVRDVAKRA